MSKEKLDQLLTVVKPNESIVDTIRKMSEQEVYHNGIAAVVDAEQRLVGVFNDGDVLRLISKGIDLDKPVEAVMVKDPIAVQEGLNHEGIISEVQKQLRDRGSSKNHVRYVLIIDNNGILLNVIDYVDLLNAYKKFGEKVAIYGQGFVGLTLSASLSNIGHEVIGVDINEELVQKLNQGKVQIHEPRLDDIVTSSLEQGTLSFATNVDENFESNIHIIAVGTPVNKEGSANLDSLKAVAKEIGNTLHRGDLVMLRSTVPVGTTREVVKPILEELSDYKAGQDFYLAFTPERTAEGKAMVELRELPQIVGGLTSVCTQKAAAFWSTLTDTVVQVSSLEASELVKLINNSYRDLSFSFANSVAELSDKYNIDSFKLINAANEGYPRNSIPSPSPGVGGYCLTKDPYLFAAVNPDLGHAKLAKSGRNINEKAAHYPITVIDRYVDKHGLELSEFNVFIIGLAFKGWPETNDLRGSSSLLVANELKKRGAEVLGWDAVVDSGSIKAHGIEPVEFDKGCNRADVILIMNNHPDNIPHGFLSKIKKDKVLLFDGWSMLSSNEVESINGLTYSTMGYLSKN